MSREQGLGPDIFLFMEVLSDSPGDAQSIKSTRSSAYFIQQDQAFLRGVIQDPGRLEHFHHERGLTDAQKIHGPDSGEDTVDHAYRSFLRRHERAHLGQDADQSDLPQVGGLSPHIRPCHDQNLIFLPVQECVVGDKRLVVCHFDNRMPALHNPDPVLSVDFRTAEIPDGRKLCQRGENIQGCDRLSNLLKPFSLLRNPLPDFEEQVILQLRDPLLGIQDLLFVFLEFGCDKPL